MAVKCRCLNTATNFSAPYFSKSSWIWRKEFFIIKYYYFNKITYEISFNIDEKILGCQDWKTKGKQEKFIRALEIFMTRKEYFKIIRTTNKVPNIIWKSFSIKE